MEKRLKKTVKRNFRAKDIDWEYFECIEEVSSNTKEYNEEGAILREMLSSIDFTLYKYEDGKLVKKCKLIYFSYYLLILASFLVLNDIFFKLF